MSIPRNEIVVATGNKNKLAELRTVGARFGLKLLSPEEAKEKFSLSPVPEVEETGETFAENALLKAKAFVEWSGMPSLGDDSGIEIDALGGKPGIHSARYAGKDASDSDKMNKLLSELDAAIKRNPNLGRGGRFRCVLALMRPDGIIFEAEGALEGHVLTERRGEMGFGYDPILLIDELGKTFAELDFEVTCEKGFRAKAAESLFSRLKS